MVIQNDSKSDKTEERINNMNGSTNSVPPASAHVGRDEDLEGSAVKLNDNPGYKPRKKLRVVTIGAGYSGLTLAHKLRYQHPEMENIMDNIIYEANDQIGGTW